MAAGDMLADRGARRFYKSVTAERTHGGYGVKLDGKRALTHQKNPLVLPGRAMAREIAKEWSAQDDRIKMDRMPLTRLANSAIDWIGADNAGAVGEIGKYAASDLLCYRARGPQTLTERQGEYWDSIIKFAENELKKSFKIIQGLVFESQPQAVLDALAARLVSIGPFELAGLHLMTTLTGSAILTFAVHSGCLDADRAWVVAHVDEDWQIEQWGEDEEAVARRQTHFESYLAAAAMVALSRDV